jgi:hypothetical protein
MIKQTDPRHPMAQPVVDLPYVPEPRDEPYCGTLRLQVHVTDAERRIFQVTQTIPASAGPVSVLYPKWLPRVHAPQAQSSCSRA